MRLLSVLGALCSLCCASIAHGQEIEVTSVPVVEPTTNLSGRWRLHAELSPLLVRGQRSLLLWERVNERDASYIARPLGQTPTVGLGLGYGVSRHVVFGVTLAGGYEQLMPTSARAITISSWVVDVAPYAAVVLGKHAWRPFIGLSLHARYDSQTRQYPRDQIVGTGRVSVDHIGWGAGIAGGVHAFVSDAVSLDLGLRVAALSSDNEWCEELSLQLGLSGWL